MRTKQIILNVPESQEDCDNMEDCDKCYYYSRTGNYECETFLEGLDKDD